MKTHLKELHKGIYIIDNLFTDNEINDFTDLVVNNTCKHTFTRGEFKNGRINNTIIPEQMYTKIKPFLPENYDNYIFKKACNRIFYSEINENQLFNIHTDTGSFYDSENKMYSKFVVLIYLNSSGLDFQGGHTQFYDNNFNKTINIIPKKNRTVIFDIDLFHSGEKVFNVIETKKWIGTEIICQERGVTHSHTTIQIS